MAMDNGNSIFVSAGDPSADNPGKNLITEIKHTCPDLNLFGLGGPLMQKAGLERLADHRSLAVMGFWEVVPKFVFFRNLLNRCAHEIRARGPRAVILIDYPGFNLRLAKKIEDLDIPVIYYVSPQVWAWGGGRIDLIRKTVDRMLVIFPFEVEFYTQHGIDATFVGHPIVDTFRDVPDKQSCRRSIGVSEQTPLIALLPGSRTQEVKRMLPAMVDAADQIIRYVDRVAFVVAGVDDVAKETYTGIIGRRDIPIFINRTPQLINGADLVVTSSGTATIETAYFTTPMVVIYKTGFLTYQIARRLIRLNSIGMVNIVAGRTVVPELIQGQANGRAIAREVMSILGDKSRYDSMVTELGIVRDKLGEGNAARRAVDAIREVVRLC